MPRLAAKHPIASEQITRTDYLKSNYKQAAGVIATIEKRIKPFEYGIDRDELNKQYRFVSAKDSKSFFDAYFSELTGSENVNGTHRDNCHKLTMNRSNIANENASTLELFDVVFSKLLSEMKEQRRHGKPFFRTVVGPTGAGKTAFSKGLITATIKKFWSEGIVPCRIEYSRFVEQKRNPTEGEIVSYIRQCQLRDLLIWLFFSGRKDLDDVFTYLSGVQTGVHEKLVRLREISAKFNFMEDKCSLLKINETWEECVGYIDDLVVNNNVLDILNEKYGMAYFISLDGFDVVNVEDFLISNETPAPIDTAVQLLKGILGKLVKHNSFRNDIECHFVLYLRDTTYHRLKLELSRSVGGERVIPRNWIVPPTYRDLVHKVSIMVGVDVNNTLSSETIDSFTDVIGDQFRKCVFNEIDPGMKRPISSIFGWNARFMKRHIGRMLYYSLDQLINDSDLGAKLLSSGAGEKWLWATLISDHRIDRMVSYHVLEELFLDNSRQLRPKVKVSSATVTKALHEGKIKKAIKSLEDYGETVGFFDCILNYSVKENLQDNDMGNCLPSLLITVRVLQFISLNGRCNIYQIHDFLERLGYKTSENTVTFLLYLLLRNEVITWRGTENIKTFYETQFSVNFVGLVLIKKMLFSVSYFSESLCIAETPVSGLSSELVGRDFSSNKKWITNCAYNSVVGFNIVKSIEDFERSNAVKNNIAFDEYELTQKMRDSLSDEIGKICHSVARSKGYKSHVKKMGESLQKLSLNSDEFENLWSTDYV